MAQFSVSCDTLKDNELADRIEQDTQEEDLQGVTVERRGNTVGVGRILVWSKKICIQDALKRAIAEPVKIEAVKIRKQ